jgi:hypothetical protein
MAMSIWPLVAVIVAEAESPLLNVLAQTDLAPVIAGIVTAALMILVALGVAVMLVMRSRQLRARLAEMAAELGLNYQRKADRSFRDAWSVVPEVKKAGTIKHVMAGRVGGLDVTVFQHSYVVFAGQAPVVITHSIYSTPAPGWPNINVARRGWFSRWALKRGRCAELLTGDNSFDTERVVRTADHEFAAWLLGPEMRALLLEDDRVTWQIVEQQLCLVYRGALKPEKIRVSVDRLRRFWAAVPAESADAQPDTGAAAQLGIV